MTEIVAESSDKLDNWMNSGPWHEGTRGERIAVRLSSLDTNGAYAIVESKQNKAKSAQSVVS